MLLYMFYHAFLRRRRRRTFLLPRKKQERKQTKWRVPRGGRGSEIIMNKFLTISFFFFLPPLVLSSRSRWQCRRQICFADHRERQGVCSSTAGLGGTIVLLAQH